MGTATTHPATPEGRTAGALVRDPTYGPFLVAKTLSVCGMWVQNIAAAVLMYELTRSALMVGVVSMVQFAGPLVLSMYAGALTDRVDRRKLLMAGRVGSGTAVGILGLTILVQGTDGFGGPVVLLVGVLIMGIGLAFSSPPMQAIVPSLVPDEDLEQAMALNAAAPSIARTVGPAFGAGLLVLGGPGLAFVVAATAHWALVAVLLRIRPRPVAAPSARADLLGGLRHLRADKTAAVLVVGIAAVAIGAEPAITLAPPFADQLGGGSQFVGVLTSAFGVGALLITVSIRRLRTRASLRAVGVAGFWTSAVGLGLAAVAPTPLAGAIAFGVAGAGFMMASVSLTTRLLTRVPDELRGRVMALWSVAFVGSRPLGALVVGGVAEVVSVRTSLATVAVLMAAASLLSRADARAPTESVPRD